LQQSSRLKRAEFRRHRLAKEQFLGPFFAEWTQYLLQVSTGRVDMQLTKELSQVWVGGFVGVIVPLITARAPSPQPAQFMNDEQKAMLEQLQDSITRNRP
jgi:hypothetical protein